MQPDCGTAARANVPLLGRAPSPAGAPTVAGGHYVREQRVLGYGLRVLMPRVNATDNAVKGTDNAVKGTDNAVKRTDNAVKRTDIAVQGMDDAVPGGLYVREQRVLLLEVLVAARLDLALRRPRPRRLALADLQPQRLSVVGRRQLRVRIMQVKVRIMRIRVLIMPSPTCSRSDGRRPLQNCGANALWHGGAQ